MRVCTLSHFSHVWLFAALWTVAYEAPLSMGFSRQGCWSGLPFPSPGDLSDPGIESRSPALQADCLPSEPPGKLYYRWTGIKTQWSGWTQINIMNSSILIVLFWIVAACQHWWIQTCLHSHSVIFNQNSKSQTAFKAFYETVPPSGWGHAWQSQEWRYF